MRSRSEWVVALILSCLLPFLTAGQSNRGRISGQVTDSSGAAIPGARVRIENLGTHIARNLVTNNDGNYVATVSAEFIRQGRGLQDGVRARIQVEVANDIKLISTAPGVLPG
jgi:hypothetical protein